jgi:hypothetical protein
MRIRSLLLAVQLPVSIPLSFQINSINSTLYRYRSTSFYQTLKSSVVFPFGIILITFFSLCIKSYVHLFKQGNPPNSIYFRSPFRLPQYLFFSFKQRTIVKIVTTSIDPTCVGMCLSPLTRVRKGSQPKRRFYYRKPDLSKTFWFDQ